MQKHKFNTLRERLLSATAITTGLLAYGYALSTMFPPALLAVTAGVVGIVMRDWARILANVKLPSPKESKDFSKLPVDHPLSLFAQQAAAKLDRNTPDIYVCNAELALRARIDALPFGLRQLHQHGLRHSPKSTVEALHKSMFAYDVSRDIVTVSDASIHQASDEQQRANMSGLAHELAHSKVDGPWLFATKEALDKSTKYLVLTSAAIGLVGSFGISLPFSSAAFIAPFWANALMLTTFNMAAKLGLNYAARVKEVRADRNALLAGATIAGTARFIGYTASSNTGSQSSFGLYFRDLGSTHPADIRRIWALQAEERKYQQAAPVCNRTLAP